MESLFLCGGTMLPTEVKYEELRAEYLELDARGIPMSVRERYEKGLSELRAGLQRQMHVRRIGEILLEMNAIDWNTLTQALAEQAAEGAGLLLGEILIRRGWADSDAIRRGVERQAAELAQTGRAK